MEALTWLLLTLLAVFTARRCLFILASILPAKREQAASASTPALGVLVAARDEECRLPGLLESLARIEYPADKIRFVLVNDGSRDATGRILEAWAGGRLGACYLAMPRNLGKAEALNRALDEVPEAELIAVYDADLRPEPGSLRVLASAFANSRVGAAAGYRRPLEPGRSPAASYAALESWVHQFVTQAGKERLGLNPTTMGGHCVYRRQALEQIGRFPAGSLSEDIEVSLALVAAGWRTRFFEKAVAANVMVDSLGRYWNQRTRWTRGIYRSARKASALESWMVATGYADRLVFLASVAGAALGACGWWVPALYLCAPAAAVLLAVGRAKAPPLVVARVLLSAVPMFAVDVAATLVANISGVLGRQVRWQTSGALD